MFIEARMRNQRLSLSSRCFLSSRSRKRYEAVENAEMAGDRIAPRGRWQGWGRGGDTHGLHRGSGLGWGWGWGLGWGLGGSASRGRVAQKSVVFTRPRVAPGGVCGSGEGAPVTGTGDQTRDGYYFTAQLAFSHFLHFFRNNSIL